MGETINQVIKNVNYLSDTLTQHIKDDDEALKAVNELTSLMVKYAKQHQNIKKRLERIEQIMALKN